jgi:hypothetical protein
MLRLVALPKVLKGDLDVATILVDLEHVESRQAVVRDDLPLVDEIGSDRVRFLGCDLAFSKLEPYLAKFIVKPDPDWIGSTEWIGFNTLSEVPVMTMAYLLMLEEFREAYRRLQSGKRHARLDPREMLALRVGLDMSIAASVDASVLVQREEWSALRLQQRDSRNRVDATIKRLIR